MQKRVAAKTPRAARCVDNVLDLWVEFVQVKLPLGERLVGVWGGDGDKTRSVRLSAISVDME